MTFAELREIVRSVKETVQCPHCKGGFTSTDIHVIGTFFNEALFHLICPECTTHSLLSVVLSRGRANIVRKHVSLRRLSGKPISLNDVLDIKNILKQFDGDFKTLLFTDGHEQEQKA